MAGSVTLHLTLCIYKYKAHQEKESQGVIFTIFRREATIGNILFPKFSCLLLGNSYWEKCTHSEG